jgi:hypothetical protein
MSSSFIAGPVGALPPVVGLAGAAVFFSSAGFGFGSGFFPIFGGGFFKTFGYSSSMLKSFTTVVF